MKPEQDPPGSKRALIPALTVGVMAGIDNISVGVAIASLFFSGALAPGLGVGFVSVMMAAVILALVIGLGSGFRNAVALVQEGSMVVLAATVSVTVGAMAGPLSGRIATALAIIGTCSVVTGLVLWGTGALRLGRFVRLLPYPVVAGFVAASGWLLVEGAFAIMMGELSVLRAMSGLDRDTVLLKLLPALGLALVLFVVLRNRSSVYVAPTVLVLSILLFYAALHLSGTSVEEARLLEMLPSIELQSSLVIPVLEMWHEIDWKVVASAAPGMLAVTAITLIGVLLNTGGVELATGRDIEPNRELKVIGLANLASGVVGGPSGYTGLGITVMAGRLGARGRETGLATAGVLFVGLLFAGSLVSSIPLFVSAGLVLYLGLELLVVWLVQSFQRLPRLEWLVVFLITVVVAITNFIYGLALGILVSAAIFIYNYARLPVIRQATNGADQRSSVDRSMDASRLLAEHGSVTSILRLQGYLFFATADQITQHVRRRLSDGEQAPLRFLVLDFSHVSGIDSAATSSFIKIVDLARRFDFVIVLSEIPDAVNIQLLRSGLKIPRPEKILVERDLDHALEVCEDQLLSDLQDAVPQTELIDHLRSTLGEHPRLQDLVDAMERIDLSPGDMLIRAGEVADDVFFVAHGWVRVQLDLPDGRSLRLRTMTAGAVVGEIALYLREKRTANVLCERPATVYKMSRAVLRRIEKEDGELALLFHRAVAVSLSDKLTIANRQINSAQN